MKYRKYTDEAGIVRVLNVTVAGGTAREDRSVKIVNYTWVTIGHQDEFYASDHAVLRIHGNPQPEFTVPVNNEAEWYLVIVDRENFISGPGSPDYFDDEGTAYVLSEN